MAYKVRITFGGAATRGLLFVVDTVTAPSFINLMIFN